MKVPSIMSTQHPDCAFLPDWVRGEKITNSDELKEALFAFRLGCDEQLWDWEGKDVDAHVIKKLLIMDADYFKKNVFGEDIFITYRIPNPDLEGTEKKIVVEALESIPRNSDVARKFYGKDSVPIFEVSIPMTTSHLQMLRVSSFYEKVVVAKESINFHPEIEDLNVKNWIGEIFPKKIQIIPLVEDSQAMLGIDKILEKFIKNRDVDYMRPWLARSDPALNYGNVSCILMIKSAVSKIEKVENKTGVKMYPILATGSLPFRGFLRPDNIDNFLTEYRGFKTFAFQSAMKYDFDEKDVRKTARKIRDHKLRKMEIPKDEIDDIEKIVKIYSSDYRRTVKGLAELVNSVAKFVPSRRTRHLHVGLFGYSRKLAKGVHLPRAIKFTASLYSLGIPPEIIGMRSFGKIEEEGLKDTLMKHYKFFKKDFLFSARFVCEENISQLAKKDLIAKRIANQLNRDIESVRSLGIKTGPKDLQDENHIVFTKTVVDGLGKLSVTEMKDAITKAAQIRRSLG